jgi:hypothetical protein
MIPGLHSNKSGDDFIGIYSANLGPRDPLTSDTNRASIESWKGFQDLNLTKAYVTDEGPPL